MDEANDRHHTQQFRLQQKSSTSGLSVKKNMTKAEASLWKYVLKEKQLKGYQFRRQRPVLQYIADFLCKELMLIVEVDGITHDTEETVAKDRQRENDLIEEGFKIVRFTDEEVLANINGVADQLATMVEELEKSTPGVSRHPRRRGTIAVQDSKGIKE
ncbi:MAG: endonuclease domain-containing protein [Desulfobacterales bacterium]|nr:endonuclease domain-containing protein [Desulfobacterales bacterium]